MSTKDKLYFVLTDNTSFALPLSKLYLWPERNLRRTLSRHVEWWFFFDVVTSVNKYPRFLNLYSFFGKKTSVCWCTSKRFDLPAILRSLISHGIPVMENDKAWNGFHVPWNMAKLQWHFCTMACLSCLRLLGDLQGKGFTVNLVSIPFVGDCFFLK